jgi:hypothetical protein
MEHMETKEIHNYVIDPNMWKNQNPTQWAKSRV